MAQKSHLKLVRCGGVRADHLELVRKQITDAGLGDAPSDGDVLRLALRQLVKAIKAGASLESLIGI